VVVAWEERATAGPTAAAAAARRRPCGGRAAADVRKKGWRRRQLQVNNEITLPDLARALGSQNLTNRTLQAGMPLAAAVRPSECVLGAPKRTVNKSLRVAEAPQLGARLLVTDAVTTARARHKTRATQRCGVLAIEVLNEILMSCPT
jgi:hypothetical protein